MKNCTMNRFDSTNSNVRKYVFTWSDDFRKDQSVTVEEVDLSEEHHVLTDNVGA